MLGAFRDEFGSGGTRVVLIGSDAPQVTMEDIRTAWAELEHADVVLGPALDGGYWLIGLTTDQPSLFHSIPWGTDSVLRETMDRARAAGLRVSLLRLLADIDTADDWTDYLKRANAGSAQLTNNQGGA